MKSRLCILKNGTLLLVAAFLFLTAAFVSPTHAQIFKRFTPKPKQQVPVVFDRLPSQQELLAILKSRREAVQQLSSGISVSIPGAPEIKGSLQVEFPSRVRLKAGFMGVSEMGVDVGSNEQDFWIWSRAKLPGQPPAFYFANHEAFKRSPVQQSLPIDPNWLIDGLGLIEFRPTDRHVALSMTEGGRIQFFTLRQTPTGPQWLVTKLSAQTGVVEQQAVYDAQENLIAYANSTKHKAVAHQGVQVGIPTRIEVNMIQQGGQDVKILVKLNSISLDPLYGDPQKMWGMPNPGGVQQIDLAQVSQMNLSPNQSPVPASQAGHQQFYEPQRSPFQNR